MIKKISQGRGTALWAGLALIVGVALVAIPAAAREKYEEKFEKTETLAKDGKVYLSNISGDNVIKTWKENQVKILALKVSQASTAAKAKENAGEKLTTSKLAQKLGLKTAELQDKLVKAGLLELREGKPYITTRGKEAGGEFRMSPKFGPYFLWPDALKF